MKKYFLNRLMWVISYACQSMSQDFLLLLLTLWLGDIHLMIGPVKRGDWKTSFKYIINFQPVCRILLQFQDYREKYVHFNLQ